MKTIKILFAFLVLGVLSSNLKAQDIEVIIHETFKYVPVDSFEIIFDFEVVNISNEEQTVFEVRTINDLPTNWTSSLCFGDLCFAPTVDSVATTPEFSSSPLQPGDTLITSLHVFTDQVSIARADVQIQIGTFRNPNDRIVLDFIATTDPTVDVGEEFYPSGFYLSQNYPNPFNPSTKINYGVQEGGSVTLKVYNILGVEVSTLVNEYKSSGNYQVDFEGGELSSGVYFYSINVNGFMKTRKMILEK